jgi:hypothetical protein
MERALSPDFGSLGDDAGVLVDGTGPLDASPLGDTGDDYDVGLGDTADDLDLAGDYADMPSRPRAGAADLGRGRAALETEPSSYDDDTLLQDRPDEFDGLDLGDGDDDFGADLGDGEDDFSEDVF